MADGHIEYFALLSRILALAGIDVAEADQHLWRTGTWPTTAEMLSADASELRRQLSGRVIELVELWWLDRDKPPELVTAMQDLRAMHQEPSYSPDDIAVLKDLVPVRRRPDHHIVVDDIELTAEEIDEIDGGDDDEPSDAG